MQENWETSAYVHFEADDKESIATREASKKQFETLWNEDCYDLSPRDVSAYTNRFEDKVGKDWAIAEGRDYGTKQIISKIEQYEIETGQLVEGFMSNPEYKTVYDGFVAKGYSEGDAALLAADKHFGVKEFRQMRNDLPGNQELVDFESKIDKWKAKYGGK